MLMRLEVFKLSRRLRSYIGFLGVIGITSLVALGLYYEPPEHIIERMGGGSIMMVGKIVNALFLARFVMPVLFIIFMPLFINLVAGDMIAGEAGEGTLRTQLTRPIRRVPFVISKYLVVLIYTFVLTAFLGLFAYLLGWMVWGQGALLSIDRNAGISLFPRAEGMWRLGLGYALAAAGMLAVATIAFFLSTLSSNSLAPVGVSMMLIIIFQIIGEIPYFAWLKPYLFTTDMEVWLKAFRVPIPVAEIRTSLLHIIAYIAVFLTGSVLVFSRKDILT